MFESDAVITPHTDPGIYKRLFKNGRLNINAMRTNDLLRKDEWIQLDRAVLDVARDRLVVAQDMRAAGLVQPLGGVGVTISQYEKQSDMTDADVTMSVIAPGEEDRVDFSLVSVPIPVVHKGFRLDLRTLEASRRNGAGLDVTQATVCARKVAEKIEYMTMYGASNIIVNASPIYGLTNEPNVNPVGGHDWGTIGNIYSDVLAMVAAAETDHYYGPYNLYVATTQFGQMRAIYDDGSGESAMERVLRGIPSIRSIKVVDRMTDGTALLMNMSRDIADLAVAMDMTTVQWESMGGWQVHFRVMACLAPRVKSDAETHSGLVLITSI